MIHLKDLFDAIAYCNQHIKEHKLECKAHDASASRFYNVKKDIIRYLILNRDTYSLAVTITSHEIQHTKTGDIELIGILFKSQHLDELHVHQIYSNVNDLICSEILPDLEEYIPKHIFVREWNEQEFVERFSTIVKWAIQVGIRNLYKGIPARYFIQKIVRWYPHFDFIWGKDMNTVSIKKDITIKGEYRTYNIGEFIRNLTKILE